MSEVKEREREKEKEKERARESEYIPAGRYHVLPCLGVSCTARNFFSPSSSFTTTTRE